MYAADGCSAIPAAISGDDIYAAISGEARTSQATEMS
jgi:hypothetical protein